MKLTGTTGEAISSDEPPFVGTIHTPTVEDIGLRDGNFLAVLLKAPKRNSLLVVGSTATEGLLHIETLRYLVLKVKADPKQPDSEAIKAGMTVHMMDGAMRQTIRADTRYALPEGRGKEVDDVVLMNVGEIMAWDSHKLEPSELASPEVVVKAKMREHAATMRAMGMI